MSGMDPESLEILRDSAREFRGKTAPEMTYKAWEAVVGSWIKDAEAAKLKDPTLDTAIFGQTTSVLMWKKILEKGLRSFIDEAQSAYRCIYRKPGDRHRQALLLEVRHHCL